MVRLAIVGLMVAGWSLIPAIYMYLERHVSVFGIVAVAMMLAIGLTMAGVSFYGDYLVVNRYANDYRRASYQMSSSEVERLRTVVDATEQFTHDHPLLSKLASEEYFESALSKRFSLDTLLSFCGDDEQCLKRGQEIRNRDDDKQDKDE